MTLHDHQKFLDEVMCAAGRAGWCAARLALMDYTHCSPFANHAQIQMTPYEIFLMPRSVAEANDERLGS
jgi:hypothetical protein